MNRGLFDWNPAPRPSMHRAAEPKEAIKVFSYITSTLNLTHISISSQTGCHSILERNSFHTRILPLPLKTTHTVVPRDQICFRVGARAYRSSSGVMFAARRRCIVRASIFFVGMGRPLWMISGVLQTFDRSRLQCLVRISQFFH